MFFATNPQMSKLVRLRKYLLTYLENRTSTTDSVGSKSDHSGNTAIVSHAARPKMDVAFVIDLQNPMHLSQRKKAYEDVKNACAMLSANCHHIQVKRQIYCTYKKNYERWL